MSPCWFLDNLTIEWQPQMVPLPKKKDTKMTSKFLVIRSLIIWSEDLAMKFHAESEYLYNNPFIFKFSLKTLGKSFHKHLLEQKLEHGDGNQWFKKTQDVLVKLHVPSMQHTGSTWGMEQRQRRTKHSKWALFFCGRIKTVKVLHSWLEAHCLASCICDI